MAKKRSIGFLAGEFGPFGRHGLPDSALQGYVGMAIQGMNEDGVGCASGALHGKGRPVC
ncbi:MAG: hypothetical protein ABFC73_02185 [Clostridiaceae bacterium]